VISGADKDRKQPKTVISVMPDENKPRVLVEGVNIKTRHKNRMHKVLKGSIVKQEAPIAII
jgi:ribosomal protein L24